MESKGSDSDSYRLPPGEVTALKVLIAGPLGVGKTTMTGAVSDYKPLTTDAVMSKAGIGVDAEQPNKTTTTVALDFGRITLSGDLVLYLFGVPGQERFLFLWEELAQGALGAVVLADTTRLEESFDALARVEQFGLPYVVAINQFDGHPEYDPEELRESLQLDPATPLVHCDARAKPSSRDALLTLARHLRQIAVRNTAATAV